MPKLIDQYQELTQKFTFKPKPSPGIIRLFENPASPLPFPGQISLKDHDYVHCILGQGLSLKGEAYTVGFTMGCDDRCTRAHLVIFMLVSMLLYPKQYAFRREHWPRLKEGYELGRKSRVRNLHRLDFRQFENLEITTLQHYFGIA